MNTELVNGFSRFLRDSLLFRLWFDNSRANCCQSRLTAGARAGYSVQLKLYDRIIDTGLPVKDDKQYLLACYVSVNSNWVHPPPPPRQPPGKFFSASESRPPEQIFCLIPCLGAKNDGQIPLGWGKIFPNSKKLPLIPAKIFKKLRKLRDSTNFLFGALSKTFIF